MLPDIRAVIAAIVTALGLLTISFGVGAAFRVAQDDRAGFLHAELAQRGRQLAPVSTAPRAILIVDTPASTVRIVPEDQTLTAAVATASIERAAVVREAEPELTVAAAPAAMEAEPPAIPEPSAEPPSAPAPVIAAMPVTEAPVGGPFEIAAAPAIRDMSSEQIAAARKAARAAAAKKVRAARLARERRLAARRAAAARRARQAQAASFGWTNPQANSFDSFNNGFGNAAAGTPPRQNPTVRN